MPSKKKSQSTSLVAKQPMIIRIVVALALVFIIFTALKNIMSNQADIFVVSDAKPTLPKLASCGVRDVEINSFCNDGKIKNASYRCVSDYQIKASAVSGKCRSFSEMYEIMVASCKNECVNVPPPNSNSAATPGTTQSTTTYCTSSGECQAGYVCSSTPAGGCKKDSKGRPMACATRPYCRQAEGIQCNNHSDCFNGYSCYQPPMQPCPEGQMCAQVMPAKYCRLIK